MALVDRKILLVKPSPPLAVLPNNRIRTQTRSVCRIRNQPYVSTRHGGVGLKGRLDQRQDFFVVKIVILLQNNEEAYIRVIVLMSTNDGVKDHRNQWI